MKSKYKNLLENTAIFTIGSFGSKILSFLIVPLYTYVLTTAEYGKIDLFTTAISFMLPFTTLLIQEALIRYIISEEIDSLTAINNSILVFIYGVILILIMYPVYIYSFKFESYTIIYMIIMILNTYTGIFNQYLRAIGKTMAFTISGLLGTIVLLLSNIVFLLFFKLGVNGYFYSMLLSQVSVAIYITVCSKIISSIDLKKSNIEILKSMLKYSIPLIPNNIMWWIMSSGNRYVINYYMGDSANGIYSIAMKLPMILSMIYNIFMQAWQLSAVEENNSNERTEFHNNVFIAVSSIIIIITSIIIISVYPLFKLVINSNFIEAWKYVPLLCIATIINCFATFAGTVYIISKKSIGAFYTTIIGALINLLFNFILIKKIGLYGVALGTVIGYTAIMLIRMYHAKKILSIKFDATRLCFSFILLFFESIFVLYINGIFKYIMGLICITAIILLYRIEIIKVINVFNIRMKKLKIYRIKK